ncbi:MAG: ATP-binding protein [Cyanobacteria bacterium P01_B01_bin.77]
MSNSSSQWQAENQQYLSAAITVVKARLVERLQQASIDLHMLSHVPSLKTALEQFHAVEMSQLPSALEQLSALCHLSAFEQEILLLCAAMELDATFAPMFAALHGDAQRNYPTFSLTLGNLPEASWAALSPGAPLRHWQLVEVGPGKALTLSPLRIDERILNFLTGIYHLDSQLVGVVKSVKAADELVPSHGAIATQIAHTWTQAKKMGRSLPVLQLCGGETRDCRSIAFTAAAALNLNLHILSVSRLPSSVSELNRIARRWQRESILSQSTLLLEWDGHSDNEAVILQRVEQFLEDVISPVMVSSRNRQNLGTHTTVNFDVALPTDGEQQHLWHSLLDTSPAANGYVQQLVTQFNLNTSLIQAAYVDALGHVSPDPGAEGAADPGVATENVVPNTEPVEAVVPKLWQACRLQARPRMDNHAQRIESDAVWHELILPEKQKSTLQEIVAHLRQRSKVYGNWGFGGKSQRGLGITALFAGASGTGKTLAAEVLAQELQLDLYKIDLSTVVSKYIGETEKNLSKIFDAAESGGVILLFDEADALFGKRNEVKDSHDRYANIEVSYLLQRMESYRGLAILTTNLPDSIDKAFIRRIRFIVQFPFPEVSERQQIWSRMFPHQTPTEGLEFRKLAKLTVAGGNIRNIALNAAFFAADENQPVMMKHLLKAARSEYAKLERSLNENEIRGWVS